MRLHYTILKLFLWKLGLFVDSRTARNDTVRFVNKSFRSVFEKNKTLVCVFFYCCDSTSPYTSSQIRWWCLGAKEIRARSVLSPASERLGVRKISNTPNFLWACSTNTLEFHLTGKSIHYNWLHYFKIYLNILHKFSICKFLMNFSC